jgi:hypothetical protein
VLHVLFLAFAIDKDIIYICNIKMIQILEKYFIYFVLEYYRLICKSK